MALSWDEVEKLHEKILRKLSGLEKQKLQNLIRGYRESKNAILARLAQIDTEHWDRARLERLLEEIDQSLLSLDKYYLEMLTGKSDVTILEQILSVSDSWVEQTLGIRVVGTFAMINRPALAFLQDYELGLIKNVNQELRNQIRNQLTQAFIQGESIPQMVKRLTTGTALQRGVFPKVETRAEVIARTETIRAFNQGALEQYRSYGVRRVVWLTAHDERTCPVCRPLHKKVFPIDRIPFGGPPAHPRCRCSVVAHIVTDEDEARQANEEAIKNYWEQVKRINSMRKS